MRFKKRFYTGIIYLFNIDSDGQKLPHYLMSLIFIQTVLLMINNNLVLDK
jgi:hypothetical protein